MPDSARRVLGTRGEDAAVAWYRSASYDILARNWRCDDGELDGVAHAAADDVVVFCEVKTRSSGEYGSPFEAVTPAKQRRLRRLATRWLQSRDRAGARYGRIRFDVAAVTSEPGGALVVEVLEDAF